MADGIGTANRPLVETIDDLLGHKDGSLRRIEPENLAALLGVGTGGGAVKTKEIVLVGGDWQVDDVPPNEPDPAHPTYVQRAKLRQYFESAAAIGADLGGIDYVINGGDEVDRGEPLPRENQPFNFLHADLFNYLRLYLGVAFALIKHILGNHSRNYPPATESEHGRSFYTALQYTQKTRHFFARGNRFWTLMGQESPITRGVLTDRTWKWWRGLVRRHQHMINITVVHQPFSGMHTGGPFNDVCTEETTPDEVQTNSARFLNSMAEPDGKVALVLYFHTHHTAADQLKYKIATHGDNTTIHLSAMTGVTTSQESTPQWDLLVTFLEFNQGSDKLTVRRFNARTREPVQTLEFTLPYKVDLGTHDHASSLYAWDDSTGLISNSVTIEDNIRRKEVSPGVWASVNNLQDILRIAQTDKHRDNVGIGAGPGIFFNAAGEYAADKENGVRADAPAGALGFVRRNDGENAYRSSFVVQSHDIGYAPVVMTGNGTIVPTGVAKVAPDGGVDDILILEPGEGNSELTGVVLGTYGGSGATFTCVVGDYVNPLDGGTVHGAWIGKTVTNRGTGYPGLPTDADLKNNLELLPDRLFLYDISRISQDVTKAGTFYKKTNEDRDYLAIYPGKGGSDNNGWLAVSTPADTVSASTARIGAGGFTGVRVGLTSTIITTAAGVVFRAGSGSPEGAITGSPSSFYQRTDDGTWYRKAAGTGNTGWALQ